MYVSWVGSYCEAYSIAYQYFLFPTPYEEVLITLIGMHALNLVYESTYRFFEDIEVEFIRCRRLSSLWAWKNAGRSKKDGERLGQRCRSR